MDTDRLPIMGREGGQDMKMFTDEQAAKIQELYRKLLYKGTSRTKSIRTIAETFYCSFSTARNYAKECETKG